MSAMKELLRTVIRMTGYEVIKIKHPDSTGQLPPDFSQQDVSLYLTVRPFTLTTPERVFSLTRAVEHVVQNKVPGSYVECGVWRGGSSMAAALSFARLGDRRDLYLFDTFKGMPRPGRFDSDYAHRRWSESQREAHNDWNYVSVETVKKNLSATHYPPDRIHFVEGDVRETLPARAPEEISILRLDTDFYDSTKHELETLFPRLKRGGVLIIDDYGSFAGSRKATDEYLASKGKSILLNRIDSDSRIAVKY